MGRIDLAVDTNARKEFNRVVDNVATDSLVLYKSYGVSKRKGTLISVYGIDE